MAHITPQDFFVFFLVNFLNQIFFRKWMRSPISALLSYRGVTKNEHDFITNFPFTKAKTHFLMKRDVWGREMMVFNLMALAWYRQSFLWFSAQIYRSRVKRKFCNSLSSSFIMQLHLMTFMAVFLVYQLLNFKVSWFSHINISRLSSNLRVTSNSLQAPCMTKLSNWMFNL